MVDPWLSKGAHLILLRAFVSLWDYHAKFWVVISVLFLLKTKLDALYGISNRSHFPWMAFGPRAALLCFLHLFGKIVATFCKTSLLKFSLNYELLFPITFRKAYPQGLINYGIFINHPQLLKRSASSRCLMDQPLMIWGWGRGKILGDGALSHIIILALSKPILWILSLSGGPKSQFYPNPTNYLQYFVVLDLFTSDQERTLAPKKLDIIFFRFYFCWFSLPPLWSLMARLGLGLQTRVQGFHSESLFKPIILGVKLHVLSGII